MTVVLGYRSHLPARSGLRPDDKRGYRVVLVAGRRLSCCYAPLFRLIEPASIANWKMSYGVGSPQCLWANQAYIETINRAPRLSMFSGILVSLPGCAALYSAITGSVALADSCRS